MYILAKSRSNIINSAHVENIFIGSDGKSIKVNMVSRSGCETAKYETRGQAEFALGMLFSAMAGNERVFEFPEEVTETQLRGSGSFKTKKNRHGGS